MYAMPRGGHDASWLDRRLRTDRLEHLHRDDVDDHRVGLRPGAVDKFDENRTGIDHLAFAVRAKSELDDMAQHLDQLDIAHGPIKDLGVPYTLEFRDPDNIALEITAPK
jgi:hypothetical protein